MVFWGLRRGEEDSRLRAVVLWEQKLGNLLRLGETVKGELA